MAPLIKSYRTANNLLQAPIDSGFMAKTLKNTLGSFWFFVFLFFWLARKTCSPSGSETKSFVFQYLRSPVSQLWSCGRT